MVLVERFKPFLTQVIDAGCVYGGATDGHGIPSSRVKNRRVGERGRIVRRGNFKNVGRGSVLFRGVGVFSPLLFRDRT